MADPIIPAYLGWRNPESDRLGVRLYATDDGDSPRWDARWPAGRVAEQAISERFPHEGDRYLIVRVGDRFTPDEVMHRLAGSITELLDP